MEKGEMEQRWGRMSEEVVRGMAEWRQQHPKATFREIEAEVDQRLNNLRARMIADAALSSAQAEWDEMQPAVCPECGMSLEKKGKKKRRLQARGGVAVELEREYGVCPRCGAGLFPPG